MNSESGMEFCQKHLYWHPQFFECAHCAREKELTDITALQKRVAELEALLQNLLNKGY